jgi:hypothetical protein
VSAADSLQKRRRILQVVETDPVLFSQWAHFPKRTASIWREHVRLWLTRASVRIVS